MLVGDGSGPLTVDGTVLSRPSPPSSPFSFSEDFASTGDTFVLGPTPNGVNLTSLTVAWMRTRTTAVC